jgi:hypothetical protein
VKHKDSWYTIVIPIILLAICVGIMTSGYWWKSSDESKWFINEMKTIEVSIDDGEWEVAEKAVSEMNERWNKVIVKIQYGVERDRLSSINKELAKLKGSIKAEDKSLAMQQIYMFYRLWEDLGNFKIWD